MEDEELKIVTAKMADEFMARVNELLKQRNWRIAETEMSVTDHHYFAMMIRKKDLP